jgi:hypothetical protein
VAVTVCVTFWHQACSDLFKMYPSLWAIDSCKILLYLAMLLTFPLPFFTCRTLIIVTDTSSLCERETTPIENHGMEDEVNTLLQEPLLNNDQ